MMRILLTGGAGFIGSHVAEKLLQEGHEVCILDDLNDFYSPKLKRANLEAIRAVGQARVEVLDICEEEKVDRLCDDFRPQAVIHLAARAGVRPSLRDPLLYEAVNVRGTLILLEACRRFAVAKFVFASSSSAYGIANRLPFNENDCANLPVSPYAATKLAGEKLCYTYSHLYGIEAICLRFFTVYGPRQRPDLAIRKFTEQIYRGGPIEVFGDGLSSRDYTFYADITQGVLAALAFHCQYEIVNLGNSCPIELRTVIQTIEHILGKSAIIHTLPPQPGDVPTTYADISKAQRLLRYSPGTPFTQGVRSFVEWYLPRASIAL